MTSKIAWTTLLSLSLFSTGCGGLQRDRLVLAPDAPMLVLETDAGLFGGAYAKVAVYDSAQNQMVEYGWVEVPTGWTLHHFNWQARITERQGDNHATR